MILDFLYVAVKHQLQYLTVRSIKAPVTIQSSQESTSYVLFSLMSTPHKAKEQIPSHAHPDILPSTPSPAGLLVQTAVAQGWASQCLPCRHPPRAPTHSLQGLTKAPPSTPAHSPLTHQVSLSSATHPTCVLLLMCPHLKVKEWALCALSILTVGWVLYFLQ